MLVRAPVATSQAVWGAVERRALAIAWTAGSFMGCANGEGRRDVPSKPDSPWIDGAWMARRVRDFEAPE